MQLSLPVLIDQGSNNFSYQKASVVKGHHVYKEMWTPHLGQVLQVRPEEDNEHDEYAVAVVKNGSVVGHVPRMMSQVCWYFLNRGGRMKCEVTGHRRFGAA